VKTEGEVGWGQLLWTWHAFDKCTNKPPLKLNVAFLECKEGVVLAHANTITCTEWSEGMQSSWVQKGCATTETLRLRAIDVTNNTRMKSSTTLPDNDVAGNDVFAAKLLDA
jgi:hypothetical protein